MQANNACNIGGNNLLQTPLKNKSVPMNLSLNQGLVQAQNQAANRRDNSQIAVKKSQSVAK